MMKKQINYYDNIAPIEIQNLLEDFLLNKIKGLQFPYYYSKNLTGEKSSIERGFSGAFFNFEHKMINEHSSLLFTPFYFLLNKLNIIPFQTLRGNIFFQLPSSNNKVLQPHRDLDFPHLVFLYYVTNSDGDTIFYDDNNSEIKRISPKKGRAVIFDGSILHSGSSPTKNERIAININFLTLNLNQLIKN